jgi:hypothetical protein
MTDPWLKQHLERYAQMLEAEEAEDRCFRAALRAVFSPVVGEAIYREITADPRDFPGSIMPSLLAGEGET